MNERHVCSSRPSNVGMRLGPDVRPTRTLLVSSPARFGVEVSPSPSSPRKITHNNHSCVSNERLGNCLCGDLKLESEASRGGDAGRSFFGSRGGSLSLPLVHVETGIIYTRQNLAPSSMCRCILSGGIAKTSIIECDIWHDPVPFGFSSEPRRRFPMRRTHQDLL